MLELDYTLPIDERPLPEIARHGSVDEHVRALLAHDIPGFIIRYDVLIGKDVEPDTAHLRNKTSVTSAIESMHPGKHVFDRHVPKFNGLGNHTVGLFHHDVDIADDPSSDLNLEYAMKSKLEPFISTTMTGGGDIYVASMGSNPALAIAAEYSPRVRDPRFGLESELENPSHPHNLLLIGRVDPELVRSAVYTGYISAGDSVILAGGRTKHGSWHRFDTDHLLGRRRVMTTELYDSDKGTNWEDSDNYSGFDIR